VKKAIEPRSEIDSAFAASPAAFPNAVRVKICARHGLLIFAFLSVSPLVARDAPAPSGTPAPPAKTSALGSEEVIWDGKNWNATDDRSFEERFEKYLNSAEEVGLEDTQYRAAIAKIIDLTARGNASSKNLDEALHLLTQGARCPADQRLCDALLDAIREEYVYRSRQDQKRLSEVSKELSAIQAKVEFQAMIVQLFFRRRFLHVLIGTSFYHAVFSDDDVQLNLGKDAKELFLKNMGSPPTLDTLDALANDAIRHTHESVQAYVDLLQKNDQEGAMKKLKEAFTIGEFLPEIRILPLEKKRPALEFIRSSAASSQPSK
jgi:hypothetical protein